MRTPSGIQAAQARPTARHRSPVADKADRSNISDAKEMAGSHPGSHKPQMPSDAEPQRASISPAKWHIRRPQATPSHRLRVTSKQRVAGSNPARRAQVRGLM
jgi:hypothetical protein